jgi:hypothetical protein
MVTVETSVRRNSARIALSAAIACICFLSLPASAQTESVIYSFPSNGLGGNSSFPNGITLDSSGNFYVSTEEMGAGNVGSIVELSPIVGGGLQATTIYSFTDETDGESPFAPVVIDSAGNLYGQSGNGKSYGKQFFGTVFQLAPQSGGTWKFTTLHEFSNGNDGSGPFAAQVLDSAGNIYGAASYGGANKTYGDIYKISPEAGGGWHLSVLHAFTGASDGGQPFSNLIFDSAGNLYGTASIGGSYTNCKLGCGTVYKLSPTTGGGWHFTTLFEFNAEDGEGPVAGLAMDASGHLYGTTSGGGPSRSGVAFKLSRASGGMWHETVLHVFTGGTTDGNGPATNVVLDGAGNVYGVTQRGGMDGNGVVFKLSHSSGGSWTESIVYNFSGLPDALQPFGAPIFDSAGNLWGNSSLGGTNDGGATYEITAP